MIAIGYKFAYSIHLVPDPKLAAVTKRDVTSVFINLVLSQSEEKTKLPVEGILKRPARK